MSDPRMDWLQFRAVVAEEATRALGQARKVANDEQRRAAEATTMEVARLLALADAQDLTATYASPIVTVRNQVRAIWESELRDFENRIGALQWPSREVRPRFEEVLAQCGVRRTLTVLGASLALSAVLSTLPNETAYHAFRQEYDRLCEQLIAPLRRSAEWLQREIHRAADEEYWALKSGQDHDDNKRYFAERRETLATELARVVAMIRAHAAWFDPPTVGRSTHADSPPVILQIPAPVYTIARR